MLQLGFGNTCGFNMKSSLVLILSLPTFSYHSAPIFEKVVGSLCVGKEPWVPLQTQPRQLGQGKPHLANLWAALMGPQGTPSAVSSSTWWPQHKPPGETEAGSRKKLGMSGGTENRKAWGISGEWKNYNPHSYRCSVSRELWTNVPALSGQKSAQINLCDMFFLSRV